MCYGTDRYSRCCALLLVCVWLNLWFSVISPALAASYAASVDGGGGSDAPATTPAAESSSAFLEKRSGVGPGDCRTRSGSGPHIVTELLRRLGGG
jgi:hypothetical protein